MLISEQKYSNTSRLYYHGKIKDFDESKSSFEEFYLTTKKIYALPYAGRDGVVEVYHLKSEANIFNMKSFNDEATFRKFCQTYRPDFLWSIDLLKERDWASIGGGELRNNFIDIVKFLKYDGYFNYEIDEQGIKRLHKFGVFKFKKEDLHSPAIAIFDKNKIKKVDELKTSDIVDRNEELRYVRDEMLDAAISKKFSIEYFKKIMMTQTFTVSEDDIDNIRLQITQKDLEHHIDSIEKYAESLMKRLY